MLLNALAIQNAKPKAKPYKLSDGGGLYLCIEPHGSKLRRFRYRFDSKEKMISFGAFPTISLASARTKRDDARTLIADGKDPSQQKRLDKIIAATAANNTFGAIADEYLNTLDDGGAAAATIAKNRWLLKDLAAPLCKRPVAEITPAEILLILKKVEKGGRRETARKLRGIIGTVFRLAVATLRAPNDPTYALRGALAAQSSFTARR
jgi:Arm DNA-binding domain